MRSSIISHLLAELKQRHKPKERLAYLIDFIGFSRIFGLRILPASSDVQLQLPAQLDDEIGKSDQPHVVLAERLTQAISSLEAHRSAFDVLLLYLPEKWERCFYGWKSARPSNSLAAYPTHVRIREAFGGRFFRFGRFWGEFSLENRGVSPSKLPIAKKPTPERIREGGGQQ